MEANMSLVKQSGRWAEVIIDHIGKMEWLEEVSFLFLKSLYDKNDFSFFMSGIGIQCMENYVAFIVSIGYRNQ